MSQCYGPLAARYDALTGDVPYDGLETWYETAFAHSGRVVRTVLDLCCGTGTLSLLLAERGYEMICVDASAEMLSVFQQKLCELLERHAYEVTTTYKDIKKENAAWFYEDES